MHTLEQPRVRPWNDNPHDDFVAIDFETATGLRTSACALGMVKVIDGVIVQKYYTIINPVRDEYTDREPNLRIHNIPLSVCEKFESFEVQFETIKRFINNFKIVCHNKGADIAILKQTMEFYGLTGISFDDIVCTYQLTKMSLAKCCELYNITLDNHHDALCDAEACAKIYLALIDKPYQEINYYQEKYTKAKTARQKLSIDEIENKDTLFFDSNVVITGTFNTFPDRQDLANLIQKCGAKINTSISKKTNYVVMGENAGPKKIQTISELQSIGVNIVVLKEKDTLEILGLNE